MTDDLISRQAEIDALHTQFRDGFDGDKWWNSTHVLAVIESLPPAEPRWIPVTERLPEDGRYLCTYQNGEGICVDFGLFANGEWFVEPVAYMPLPEPWKGEDE